MQTISEIRALLEGRGLRPKHALGQNFLHDKNQIQRLLDAASLDADTCVLEVGPGTGTLTEALLASGASVIACELDPAMAAIIEERIGDQLTLIEGDCLDKGRTINPAILEAIGDRPFKLVANLPYQAASPLMASLALHHERCLGQYVTIQKEVADRLVATPASGKAYGPLGILVQSCATVERIGVIPPSCFWPVPKVISAMVAIHPTNEHRPSDPAAFATFVTELFGRRRKQIGSALGDVLGAFDKITPDMRPDMLSVAQLVALFEAKHSAQSG